MGTTNLEGNFRSADRRALGARLQGVQHFGLTVQNMDRAFEFYTEILGGTEVMRDGDFQGERIHNTLLTDQEIEARERRVNPCTMGVPDLRGGAQRLDVRFIQFDNVVIELLQYRDAEQPMGSGNSFAEALDHMSPAFPRMMHICLPPGLPGRFGLAASFSELRPKPSRTRTFTLNTSRLSRWQRRSRASIAMSASRLT